jgi:hypothetical protein
VAPDILAGPPTAGHRTGHNGAVSGDTGGTGVDEDRGFGSAGAPPPPPAPTGTPAGGEPPPPPPASPPATIAPGWGTERGTPAGPQGWVSPTEVPAAWGAVSPTAQVGWDRPPSGNNGCLRACLIVGGILVVLLIVGGIALSFFVSQLVEQVQENPDAFLGGECELVSSAEVSDALGREVEVLSLDGFIDGTMGSILDKRLLPDATDCYFVSPGGTTGRIAAVDTDAETVFRTSRAEAEASFLDRDVELGDEAFCTTIGQQGSGGVLVRFDQRVVYVSIVAQGLDDEDVCDTAQAVARTLEP